MELSKPLHNKFIFHGLDEKTYTKYAETYSKCKKYGFRGISAFVSRSRWNTSRIVLIWLVKRRIITEGTLKSNVLDQEIMRLFCVR